MGGNYSKPRNAAAAERVQQPRRFKIAAVLAAPVFALSLAACNQPERIETAQPQQAVIQGKATVQKAVDSGVKLHTKNPRGETNVVETSAPLPRETPETEPAKLGQYQINEGLRGMREAVTTRDYDECMARLSKAVFGGTDIRMYPNAADVISRDKLGIYRGYQRRSFLPKQVIDGLGRGMPNTYDLLKIEPHTAVALIATHYRPSAELEELYGIEGGIRRDEAERLAEVFLDFSRSGFGGEKLPVRLDRHLAGLIWNWGAEWERAGISSERWGDVQNMLTPSNVCKVCTYSSRRGSGVFGEVGLEAPDPENRGEYLRRFERNHCD